MNPEPIEAPPAKKHKNLYDSFVTARDREERGLAVVGDLVSMLSNFFYVTDAFKDGKQPKGLMPGKPFQTPLMYSGQFKRLPYRMHLTSEIG